MFTRATFLNRKLINFTQCRGYKNILRLRDRGVFHEVFPHEALDKIQSKFGANKQTIYAGFDPTSDSLHIGNLLVLIGLLHAQRGQHQAIALIGGATGKIGDPSGRNTERKLLDENTIDKNVTSITKQIERIFANHQKYFCKSEQEPLNDLIVVNNADWYREQNFVDFVANVGRHLRMGQLLSRSSVRSRLESEEGLSFTEFTYQAFQAFDWLQLFKNYHCKFQLGGSDQMGNIMTGCELITRVTKQQAYGLVMPIITNEEGDKFGKSAGNAVWLSQEKTSEYAFYQFFLRQPDSEAEKLLKLFSFLPTNEIFDLIEKHKRMPELREAQKCLADQLTLLIHGEEGLNKARSVSEALFSGDLSAIGRLKSEEVKEVFSGAPYKEIYMEPGTTTLDAALQVKCFGRKEDAERIIKAGGFYINLKRISNPEEILTPDSHMLPNKISLFRVGKKNFHVVKWL